MAKPKSVLGKGLSALLEDVDMETPVASASLHEELPMEKIRPNPNQPRKHFEKEALEELAASIRSIGVVQPITVREVEDGQYEIIAGERRFRAAGMAGLTTIPAYVRKMDGESVLEMSLVENIQRSDLNAIEIALSYKRLMDECHLTQEALSSRVGKQRSTIANYLRLFALPVEVQVAVRDGKISMGHARALLGLNDTETQLMMLEQILIYDFSVRKVEELVREMNEEKKEEKPLTKVKKLTKSQLELQARIARLFDARVKLRRNDSGKGQISIAFRSDEELDRIIEVVNRLEELK